MLTPEKLGSNPTEFSQQVALFAWAAENKPLFPALDMLFAIKNEEKSGSAILGARAKVSGVRAGVPDIFLACPYAHYAGLFIEMKKKGGTVSGVQKEWHEKLRHVGYGVAVCYSWEEARDVIVDYLEQK